eukprot:4817490-Prymnesium_polylepis.1
MGASVGMTPSSFAVLTSTSGHALLPQAPITEEIDGARRGAQTRRPIRRLQAVSYTHLRAHETLMNL